MKKFTHAIIKKSNTWISGGTDDGKQFAEITSRHYSREAAQRKFDSMVRFADYYANGEIISLEEASDKYYF